MDYLTNDTELTAVADAIREKAEITDSLEWPDGFIQAIEDCETGGPELEWLWGNQITNTMSGTIDSIDDAYAAPILNLGVDGVSEQVTTTGKNLLDTTVWREGYYIANSGNPASYASSHYSENYSPVIEGSYTLNVHRGTQTDYIRLHGYDANKQWVKQIYGEQYNAGSGWYAKTGIVIDDSVKYVRISAPNSFTEIMLESGASTPDTSYEPYTGGKPSPNPDYPQDILRVDDLEFNVCGKNLAIDSDTEYSLTTSYYAHYDIAALKQDEPAFTVSIDATVPTGQTLQLYGWDGKNNSNYGRFVLQSDGRYATSINDEYNLGYFRKVEELRIYSQPYTGGTSVITKVSKCQLEYGTTATAYEPYHGQSVPLYNGTLRSLPDGTKDELHLTYLKPSKDHEGWAWYSRELVQRVDAYTFPANCLNAGPTDLGDGWYRYAGYNAIMDAYDNVSGLCDKAKYKIDSTEKSYHVYTTKGNNAAVLAVSQASTVEAVQAEFAGGTLLHACTPTTTQLDPIELPIMPSENATVWCDGGSAQPTFMLEYIQNANIVISRLEDTIADLATS